MNSVTNRIDTINSFELIGNDNNEKIDRHLQSNFYILLICCIGFSVTLTIVLSSIISQIFGIETRFSWNRIGLIVLISVNLYNAVGKAFYKKLILKHLKFLQTSFDKTFDKQLNTKLADIVVKLNKPLRHNLILGALMVIILIGCLINFINDTQFIYYKFFIIPTILFYVLTAFDIAKNYNKIKANIDEVERIQFN